MKKANVGISIEAGIDPSVDRRAVIDSIPPESNDLGTFLSKPDADMSRARFVSRSDRRARDRPLREAPSSIAQSISR